MVCITGFTLPKYLHMMCITRFKLPKYLHMISITGFELTTCLYSTHDVHYRIWACKLPTDVMCITRFDLTKYQHMICKRTPCPYVLSLHTVKPLTIELEIKSSYHRTFKMLNIYNTWMWWMYCKGYYTFINYYYCTVPVYTVHEQYIIYCTLWQK